MNFNPTDKIPDILERFKEYDPKIRRKNDDGYDWLDENEVCVEIPNSSQSGSIEVKCCDDDREFILFFASNHAHYYDEEYWYDGLITLISDILNNKCCSAGLICGENKEWLGSSFETAQSIHRSIWDVFYFVLKYDQFSNKLKSEGGEAKYVFWNSQYNHTVKIEKMYEGK